MQLLWDVLCVCVRATLWFDVLHTVFACHVMLAQHKKNAADLISEHVMHKTSGDLICMIGLQ